MNRVVDTLREQIDYRLNLLGIRVTSDECQLIAKDTRENWTTLGQSWDLPIEFPRSSEELARGNFDTLRLTAYQYDSEYPGTDLREVLAREKSFDLALNDFSPNLRVIKKAS